MKISEFAKRTGVTVKTLLHYDKIGLLKPSSRTEAGYRIYSDNDFIILQQITTLKYMGLSLDEIKGIVDKNNKSLKHVINSQIDILEEKKKHIDIVISSLNKAQRQIQNNAFEGIEELIDIIKITNMEVKARDRFEDASKEYKTDSYYWRAKTQELINKLLTPNTRDVILDLGCGNGKQIIELSKDVNLAIGIDISEGMIKKAFERIAIEKVNNAEFYIGTFEEPELNINLKEKRITKIISNYALHHLTTKFKEKAIEKMISLGGESLESIIIGDLMFFEKPSSYIEEFSMVGYGPEVDSPSTVEELKNCFKNYDFTVELHKLHPLVGVLVANRK
ncbi:MerR family transcriptional regulator [Clostridium paridis]|uniref:MerR family transcriptional regulator n=1 Tax=Clostridium paridis TaxID=2803863 RepID=A0A937FG79_9CLOT|nr:MerR family transcriptional regulator [Clostridium paridis]MBL4931697.1 MerR family transcriptional regulator [Clostridium paridis]